MKKWMLGFVVLGALTLTPEAPALTEVPAACVAPATVMTIGTAAPTSAAYPSCDSLLGRWCTSGFARCINEWGVRDVLMCQSGVWTWA